MKFVQHSTRSILVGAAICKAAAAIVVPGANGSDGALNITNNTVIDLSLAVTGSWDAVANATNAGKGTYDPARWAVVFKYSNVSIRSNATVTFKNHPSRAPVVWLVSSNVVIEAGSLVDLSGQSSGGTLWATLAEPGPGGFRGGAEYVGFGAGSGPGFGPGGGAAGGYNSSGGYWEIYGGKSAGHSQNSSFWQLFEGVYGNPSLLPLVGGSGGGGMWDSNRQGGGGAGGGAILIAAQGTNAIAGRVHAIGGQGTARGGDRDGRGNGSGGSIRVVSDVLMGGGVLDTRGGEYWNSGSPGRIRLERVSTDGVMTFNPQTPSVVPLQAGAVAQVWMPTNGPSVRIVSIGGVAAPADPRASFGGAGADVSLPQTATVPVVLETTNVEDASKVKVRIMPRANAQLVEKEATLQQVVSTSPRVIRWVVDLPTSGGYAAIQARVIRP